MTPGFDSAEFLSKLADGKFVVEQQKHEIVYMQGDAADFVGYIQRGKVKLSAVSGQGKEAVIGFLGAGEFFGESCLTGQKLRQGIASIQEQAVIVRIPNAELLRLVHQEPAFAEFFMAHLLERNARAQADLLDQLLNSSEKRLARILLLLADAVGESKSIRVLPQINHETLAEMIGTTRPRVSAFMNNFRKRGLIQYRPRGQIEIHHSRLNAVLHENGGDHPLA